MVSATKGFDPERHRRMSELIGERFPAAGVAVLSGPTFAREVAHGQPTAAVVASADEALAIRLRDAWGTREFRLYTNRDVAGVEIGGAMKNVIALATGLGDGLGLGENARAALITRGLAEITRLGVALGATEATLAGLSGLGDLVLTCTGSLSRNRALGMALARGRSLAEAQGATRMVAEGVPTVRSALALARGVRVSVPICEAVGAVLFEGRSPGEALAALLARAATREDAPRARGRTRCLSCARTPSSDAGSSSPPSARAARRISSRRPPRCARAPVPSARETRRRRRQRSWPAGPRRSGADGPGWTYRVVPNKFPALRIEGDLEPAGEGLFDRMNGVGAHEVIIETPDHQASLATMSVDEVTDVLWAYRERLLDLKKDPRFAYVLVFKNHGEAAGASLEHPALPAHRHPHHPHHGARGAGRRGGLLPAQGALRLVRHPAPGAPRAAAAHRRSAAGSWPSPPTRRAFRARRGSSPRVTARPSRSRTSTSCAVWPTSWGTSCAG